MIHVAYRLWGGDGFFAKMLGTSMLSMFENTKEKITVHIMHNDRLTPDNRDKLCYIAGQYNQHIEFHNVEEIAGPTLRKIEATYPLPTPMNASWYPLVAHEVFPNLDKIITMGADMIFNELDIGELWQIELDEDFPFGAVAEFTKWGEAYGAKLCYDGLVEHTDYFNADLFFFNPKFFRDNSELIFEGLKFIREHGYVLAEQDCLNYLFSKKYKKLPSKFNLVFNWERKFGQKPLRLEKALYHYAGGNVTKPSFDTDDIFNRLYFEYFLKTPWATAEMFGNLEKALNKTFQQITTGYKNNLLNMANLLVRRQRAFLTDKTNIDAIKNVFMIKDDEMIIDASEPNAGQILFDEMTKSKGEKIFFILMPNYWNIRYFLLNNNFAEGIDFINATIFLSERQGFKENFDTIPIVQEL